MSHRHTSRLAAGARLLGGLGIAALAACSAAPGDESLGSSAAALKEKCPAGYERVCTNEGIRGAQICDCEETSTPDPSCTPGAPLPVPPALVAGGCASGSFVTFINYQPVFMCPAGTVVPSSLGLVSSDDGPCFDANHFPLWDLQYPGTCEGTWQGTHLASSCLTDPPAGWILVADLVYEVYDGGQGPCNGGCAVCSKPPPF